MKIGIFGGTFDPPHIGHLILAAECHYQLSLDRLLWVLTPHPPHKKGERISPLSDRLDMVRAAISDNSNFELSQIDIDRPPPHYALDTIRLLQEQNPQAHLIYLMGGDSLHDLPTWYRAPDFLRAVQAIGVMRRPGDCIDLEALSAQLPVIVEKVRFIEAPLLEISSTEIRERVHLKAPVRYYLPWSVFEIIQARHLYQPIYNSR